MRNERLAYLRRSRVSVHAHLARLEPLVAGYQAKLVEIEAEIQALAPELQLQPRRYKPNPVFARGEMTRMALDVMREAGEPLPIVTIAVRMLAAKGIPLPEPALRRSTRCKVQAVLGAMDKRGVTMKVGDKMKTMRSLASSSSKRF